MDFLIKIILFAIAFIWYLWCINQKKKTSLIINIIALIIFTSMIAYFLINSSSFNYNITLSVVLFFCIVNTIKIIKKKRYKKIED